MHSVLISDIPLYDQFNLRAGVRTATRVTWLENKLYVLSDNVNGSRDHISRLRVFADHAPYEELLSEEIVFEGMKDAFGMAASVSTRSIFFSDPFERCIWKLQIPQNEVKCFRVRYRPFKLSVGQDDELFVIMDTRFRSCSIDIFKLADVSLVKSILLSEDIYRVCCVAQSPNRDIVIIYYTLSLEYFISILSTNGEIIRTFNPKSFESLQWESPRNFVIVDTGDIFVVTYCYQHHNMIYMLNSQMTDVQFIPYYGIQWPLLIVYIKEKQQLLVSEGRTSNPMGKDEEVVKHIHVFHLSPCNLETRKLMKNLQ